MICNFVRQVRAAWQGRIRLPVTVLAPVSISVASLAVTSLLLGIQQLGGLQPLELAAFDQMVRSRIDQNPDPRLLVVTITEEDIRLQKRWPISDQVLAQMLKELERYQPQVIGLDLYRDVPQEPGHAALVTQLQSPNVIGITEIGNSDTGGTPPPPGVSEERIGFNDLVIDPDGVVRRNLMFATTETGSTFSFSLRLALAYLTAYDISPQLTPAENLQLDKAIFTRLEPDSGGYQTIDARGYQILLDYHSGRKIARQVSLTQVLNRQVAPDWIKDKIVLIGTTAPSAKDRFYTPYSSTEAQNPTMPGVLIHAQMVSQILSVVLDHRPLFWFWSGWVEGVWILGWALVGGSLAWYLRHPLGLSLSGILSLGVLLGSSFGMFTQQGWVPVITPALAFVVTGGSVVAYRAYQSQRQQQIVMRLLGQNASPEIAEALWNSRDRLIKSGKLPGQKLIATVLFTDIKSFSTISEEMPPEAVLEWLNEYLAVMAQEIQIHHGIINKFTGDGLMAVFGVPVPRTSPAEVAEDAQQAVACALAMGDRLQELNQAWQQDDLPVVQMRVGIFTGPVVVGSLGGKDRLEYGVIGDSVNIASRLESCEKDRQIDCCRVLIAAETLVHIQQQFQVESWGPIALRGKQQTVDVYRVVHQNLGKSTVVAEPEDGDGRNFTDLKSV